MTDQALAVAGKASPEVQPSASPLREIIDRLRRNPGFLLGATLLSMIVLLSVLLPPFLPYSYETQDLAGKFAAPVWNAKGTWLHPFGTDHLGRDVLAQLLVGARVSLLVGLATTLFSLMIGTALGVSAGYLGGRVDLAVNFILTIRLTLPVVLVALVVVAVMGNSLPLLVVVIGGLLWDRIAIVTRTATRQLVTQDFIISARAIGSSQARILLRELLPNLVGPIVVIGTVEFAHAVLLEAALSFLGLGVQPPLTSWGLMIAESKNQIFFRPWLSAVPGAALTCLVLAINLCGDALSDAITPDGRA